MSILGKRLKQARVESRYTQVEAAKKLGISNGTLSGYEREYRDPDTDILNKLADLYDVSVEWLLGRSDKKQTNTKAQPFNDEEKDVAKRLEEFKNDLTGSDGLNFMGDLLSEDAQESLIEAMEYIFKQTQRINKKYIPKKHRDEKDD